MRSARRKGIKNVKTKMMLSNPISFAVCTGNAAMVFTTLPVSELKSQQGIPDAWAFISMSDMVIASEPPRQKKSVAAISVNMRKRM